MSAVAQRGAGIGREWSGRSVRDTSARHLHVVPSGVDASMGANARVVMARRRFAALALVAMIVVAAILSGRAMAAGEGARNERVTVSAGETLSQIAVREMPDVRMAAAVAEIERANGLASSQVDAGQSLVIPRP